MLVTQIATAVAAFTWMLVEWALKGKPTVVGICRCGRRPCCHYAGFGFVGPVGAFAIGNCRGRRLLLGMHRLEAHVQL